MYARMNSLRTVVVALVVGVAVAAPAAAQTTIKVAEASRSFPMMPLYIAIEAGYFKEQGINIEFITMKGGPAAVNALISGDVDVAASLVETPIKVRGQGQDLRVIGLFQDRNPCALVVPTNSPAKNLSDLKGKKIGVTATGSLSDLITRAYIRRQGMAESDFEIVGLGSGATVVAALAHGDIDAAMTFDPFLAQLLTEKTARAIYNFNKEVYPGVGALVLGSSLDGPKRPILRKFVAALNKGAKTLFDDRATVTRVARAYFPGMDPQLLDAMIVSETVDTPLFTRNMNFARADYDWLVDFLLSNKEITKREKYEDIVVTDLQP